MEFARTKTAFEIAAYPFLDRVFAIENRLYVTNASLDELYVLNPIDLSIIDKVSGVSKGLDGVSAVAKNGDFVYVTAGEGASLAVFRQESDGKLTFHRETCQRSGRCPRLARAGNVLVTPGGGYVVVCGTDSNGLALFRRNATDGTLQFVQLIRNGVGGAEGLLQTAFNGRLAGRYDALTSVPTAISMPESTAASSLSRSDCTYSVIRSLPKPLSPQLEARTI